MRIDLHSLFTYSLPLFNVYLHKIPLLSHGSRFTPSINRLRLGLLPFYKFTTHFAQYLHLPAYSHQAQHPNAGPPQPSKHAQPNASTPRDSCDPPSFYQSRDPLRNSRNQWLLPRLRKCIQHAAVRMHCYRLFNQCLLNIMHLVPQRPHPDHKRRMHWHKCLPRYIDGVILPAPRYSSAVSERSRGIKPGTEYWRSVFLDQYSCDEHSFHR